MIISAHQPAYNPWLGFLHKILLSDTFVVMDDVQFEKNSFINRNKILQNDNEIMLTIPVKTKDYKDKTLQEIEVLDDRWQIKHLKSIEQSYRKSKYFDIVFENLKTIYELKSKFLVDYTNSYLELIVNYLQIDTKIVLASDLKIRAKKLDYVIELTQKLGGNIFIFGSQGKDYADVDYIKEQNIIPYFQSYTHPLYKQESKNFHPFMGVLDLLFNEERDNIKDIILNNNIQKDVLRKLYV